MKIFPDKNNEKIMNEVADVEQRNAELEDMANFLDKFFAKQNIDDIAIDVKKGHMFAKDSEGNKWKDAELYDFIMNDVLAFDEDGNLSDGLAAAEPFVDRLKKDAASFDVAITPIKESTLNEDSEENERAVALAEFLGIDVSEVKASSWDENEFETPEGDYLVVTEEEAEDYAAQDIENLFDDIGFESFTPEFRDWIIRNALDTDWFEDAVRESYESYVDDIAYEDGRLEEELLDAGIITEEDIEAGYDEDAARDAYVEMLVEDAGDPVDYCGDNFGWDWVSKVAEQNNLIDMQEVIDECIYQDGVAHFIARYDGEENELSNGLFAYRTN